MELDKVKFYNVEQKTIVCRRVSVLAQNMGWISYILAPKVGSEWSIKHNTLLSYGCQEKLVGLGERKLNWPQVYKQTRVTNNHLLLLITVKMDDLSVYVMFLQVCFPQACCS